MTRAGNHLLLWISRVALSAIFVYAGLAKLRDPQAFAESIASFHLLPAVLIDPAALTLPPLEILAAVLALAWGRMRRAGAFCLLAMLAVFSLALVSALVRGLTVDCGCFGADRFDVLSPTKNLWFTLLRDAVLTAMAWMLYLAATRPDGSKTPRQRDAPPGRETETPPKIDQSRRA